MEEPPKRIEHWQTAPKPERINYRVSPRLGRMRFLTRLLDTAIPLPGGFRIGIDPIIGLIPVAGDVIASTLSIWLVYDAARLGVQKRVLARMVLNVMIEAAVGTIPVLGNLIDAAWKANVRNMRLVEGNYKPAMKERSMLKLIAFVIGTLILVYGSIFLALYLLVGLLVAMFGPIFQL